MAEITLDQIRIFLAVAKHQHFTNAAEELHVTQPAVSAAIQSIEKQYGVKLFHRIGRRIEIAEAGKFLQLEAQNILNRVSLTERGLRELNNLQRGELRLGASQTIGNYWLSPIISQFQQKYPGIEISCILNNTEAIASGVARGEFDLGLVEGEIELFLNSLQQQKIGRDYLQIVVGRNHPWFEQVAVSVTELAETTWIMREFGSGTRQWFEQALHTWGIDQSKLKVVLEMNSGEMIKALVENGVGATAISKLTIAKELQLGLLRPIEVIGSVDHRAILNQIERPFWLLKHQERFQTKSSGVFEEILLAQVR